MSHYPAVWNYFRWYDYRMLDVMTKPIVFILAQLFMCLLPATNSFSDQTADSGKLMRAIEEGNLEILRAILKTNIDVNQTGENEGVTPLISAVMFGREQMVKELIGAGADVNKPEESNNATPLMWASILDPGKLARKKGIPPPSVESKNAIVKSLVDAGADVNRQNSWGGTALQWAADDGRLEIVQMLLTAGAKPDVADSDGLTPLMAASNYSSSNHLKIIKLLLSNGAKLENKNKNGDTALMYAINPLEASSVELLIREGSLVNAKNKEGITPLMKAARMSRLDAMKALMKAGADLNARTNSGQTVLSIAKSGGYQPAIDLLVESGAQH